MRRFVLAIALCIGATSPVSVSALGDIGDQSATLSCNDGHSVALWADTATLASLAATVSSINSAGTVLSCTLDTATNDPSTSGGDWTVYDYNPSGQAIAPRHSPNSMPATTTATTTTFNFKDGVYTALLTTNDKALTGNLSTNTLNDTVTLSGNPGAAFMSQNGDGCNAPATARFYFRSPSASGPSVGTPPAGFYTQYWWSNPVAVPLVADGQAPVTIQAHMSVPGEWSDWNGQNGATQVEAFTEATMKVQTIGLSFGGGCFFENGVTAINNPNNNEQFSSTFTES
jgi:hypothetical protein